MKTAEELYEMQKKVRNKCMVCWLAAAYVVGLMAYFTHLVRENGELHNRSLWYAEIWVAAAVVLLPLGAILFRNYSSFSKEVKRYIVEAASEGMFDSFSYNPDEGFNRDVLDGADMMKRVRSCGTDDMMIGEYNDVKFYRGDVSIYPEQNPADVFFGTWTMYSFLKPFTSDLQVTSNELVEFSSVNHTYLTSKEESRHFFRTGDPEFDRVFVCSGKDEQEAMTLLTPTVRKRLIRLYYDTKLPIMVGWKKNVLHFVTGNALAPYGYSIHSKMDLEAMVADTRRKLYLTRRVIEELIMSRSVFSEYALEQYSMPVDAGHGEELRRQ